jgi:hypothetical protein
MHVVVVVVVVVAHHGQVQCCCFFGCAFGALAVLLVLLANSVFLVSVEALEKAPWS